MGVLTRQPQPPHPALTSDPWPHTQSPVWSGPDTLPCEHLPLPTPGFSLPSSSPRDPPKFLPTPLTPIHNGLTSKAALRASGSCARTAFAGLPAQTHGGATSWPVTGQLTRDSLSLSLLSH